MDPHPDHLAKIRQLVRRHPHEPVELSTFAPLIDLAGELIELARTFSAAVETLTADKVNLVLKLIRSKRGKSKKVLQRRAQIEAMRAAGSTWKEIGQALGIKPDAARKRFSRTKNGQTLLSNVRAETNREQ